MERTHFVQDLVLLYGMAMLIAFVMRKLKQPTLVGYLLTGVVVGPAGLKLIADSTLVGVLAEVGVALLLFTVGVELSAKKLMRMKETVLASGSMQAAAIVGLAAGALVAMGLPVRSGVFWGFLLTASSTAIVIKLLHDREELDTVHGRATLGIQLFQDLCVVPMMALLPALAAPGTAQALHILLALVKSLLVVAVILVAATYLFPPVLRAIVLLRNREMFVITVIFLVLGLALSAQKLGLSLALGAFLAGIVLSESEYGHQVLAEILPFRDSFNSLFFISVGMLIDLRFVAGNFGLVGGVTAAILAGKFLIVALSMLAVGFPMRMATLVGVALAQVGEFSFVLLREGQQQGLVQARGFQVFLAAAVLSMALTPAMIQAGPRLSRLFGERSGRKRRALSPDEQTEQLRDHVILCGYGMSGQRTARMLRENSLPYVVIEMNGRVVRAARAEGEHIYFGDVSNVEILRMAGARQARAVVFAISDPAVLARAVSHARLLNPDAHIIARVKRMQEARELRLSGATDVVAEEVEAWMEIAVRVLRLYGMPREAAAEQMRAMRAEDYGMMRIMPMPGQPLRHLWHLLPQVDLELFIVAPGSALDGITLRESDLRAKTGGIVLAVVRGDGVMHNPAPDFLVNGGDQMVIIGSREQLDAAFTLLREVSSKEESSKT